MAVWSAIGARSEGWTTGFIDNLSMSLSTLNAKFLMGYLHYTQGTVTEWLLCSPWAFSKTLQISR
jgi:hypothetical protein